MRRGAARRESVTRLHGGAQQTCPDSRAAVATLNVPQTPVAADRQCRRRAVEPLSRLHVVTKHPETPMFELERDPPERNPHIHDLSNLSEFMELL